MTDFTLDYYRFPFIFHICDIINLKGSVDIFYFYANVMVL